MKPFARGALIKLSEAKEVPGLKSKTIDLNAPEIQEQATAKMAERLNDVAIENERLRAQVAELLPLVAQLAEFSSPDAEYGACAWEMKCEVKPFDEPQTLLSHVPQCPVHQAALVMDRIAAGEFGEVES